MAGGLKNIYTQIQDAALQNSPTSHIDLLLGKILPVLHH